MLQIMYDVDHRSSWGITIPEHQILIFLDYSVENDT